MKLRKQAPASAKMTLIPADTKDEKRPSENVYATPPRPTTNPFPNPIIQNQTYSESDFDEHPPAYTPTKSLSSSTRDLLPVRNPEPFTGSTITPAQKIPESNAISAHTAVNTTGPLHILGAVKSSSNVTLAKNILVDEKVSSSSWILLENNVEVKGKVDSSGKITLRDRVKVGGKVDASGSIM